MKRLARLKRDQRRDETSTRNERVLEKLLEHEHDRWLAWCAAAFFFGAAAFFSTDDNPSIPLLAAVVAIAAAAAALAYAAAVGKTIAPAILIPAAAMSAAACAGFLIAHIRVAHDVAEAPKTQIPENHPVGVQGVVVNLEILNQRGALIDLIPSQPINGIPKDANPRRLRVIKRGYVSPKLKPGDVVRIPVVILPPLAPARPGGYDLQFRDFFERVDATASARGDVRRILNAQPDVSIPNRLRIAANQIRHQIAERLRTRLNEPIASIAIATLVGMRRGIPDDVRDAFRASGLSHLLVISGLHMALFVGGAFWLVRAVLALIPALTRRAIRLKKGCAAVALLVAAVYLALSGGAPPTQRAFIMSAVILIAVMLERRAFSMRNVALAAFAVITYAPQEAVSVGCRMSFLAVIAIVAFFEVFAVKRPPYVQTGIDRFPQDAKKFMRLVRRVVRGRRATAPNPNAVLEIAETAYVYALAVVVALVRTRILLPRQSILLSVVTCLVAYFAVSAVVEIAIGPILAYYFQSVLLYAAFANVLAVPVAAAVAMPAGAAAIVLMPLGLERLPLLLLEGGLQVVLHVARGAAELPTPSFGIAAPHPLPILVIGVGTLWLCLCKGKALKICGALLIFLGGIGSPVGSWQPVLLVNEQRQAATRTSEGNLALLDASKARYASWSWLRASGDVASQREAASREGFSCPRSSVCVAEIEGGEGRVALLFEHEEDALWSACRDSRIVVSWESLGEFARRGCESRGAEEVIDLVDMRRHGTHSVSLSGAGGASLEVETSVSRGDVRPWRRLR